MHPFYIHLAMALQCIALVADMSIIDGAAFCYIKPHFNLLAPNVAVQHSGFQKLDIINRNKIYVSKPIYSNLTHEISE